MKSSIIKKFLMAISGIFLILFLTQHLLINLTSIIPDNGRTFNAISHFMGYNPFVQFILQPVLMFGVCFHFIMGFFIELGNRSNRINYAVGGIKSSWVSRNMITTGLVILAFLFLHLYDFFIPEIDYKYILANSPDNQRYFEELVHKFHGNLSRTLIYCVSFVFLGLHLVHGLSSSFQTMGLKKKYIKLIDIVSKIYSFGIVTGFILVALIHYF